MTILTQISLFGRETQTDRCWPEMLVPWRDVMEPQSGLARTAMETYSWMVKNLKIAFDNRKRKSKKV